MVAKIDGLDRAYRLLGLARRAGKVVLGHSAVLQALNNGQAFLVLIAEDASDRTRRTFERLGYERNVTVIVVGVKTVLGQVLGTTPKAVCAVCDDNFASGIGAALDIDSF